jgi:hypothetical protein
MSQSPPPDSRFLALRSAGQDATDFALTDGQVRQFMELRDQGRDGAEIAEAMGLEPAVVEQLIGADRAQAVAHRIATGELEMYPAPEPGQAVADTRTGGWVPLAVLIAVLAGVIVYAVAR